ncbi:MAG: tRNA 2-selenouridine(34) synthase MnmH [Cyclobacteriaceae bacterium]
MRSELPVVDVRSEAEFEEGHVPGAVNIPLLKNEERVQVGTDYKQKGKDQAVRTGFRLVGPRLSTLMDQVVSFSEGRELLVYCWRGGMRSENFCNFSSMAGVKTRRLTGGYKAYREKVQEIFTQKLPLIVIGGKTGSGKSDILRALEKAGEQIIDLENLASHKGSAFGGLLQPPQPSNEQFLNNLFENIISLDLSRPVWVEDESISIGKIFLPKSFFEQKKNAPVVQIEVEKIIRVDRLVHEYGTAPRDQFLAAMEKIIKKLGGQNFNIARDFLMKGDMHHTITILLDYYDKTYSFSLDKKSEGIISVYNWDGKEFDQLITHLKIAAEKFRMKIHPQTDHAD